MHILRDEHTTNKLTNQTDELKLAHLCLTYAIKSSCDKNNQTIKMFTKVLMNTHFQCKIVNIFLPIIFSICFVCSKESSH